MASASDIVSTATHLWRTVPRWRWTVVAAAAVTLASLFAGGQQQPGGGGPGQQAAPQGGSPPSASYSPPRQPGGTINITAAVDPQATRRLAQFYQAYAAADALKDRPGARCERLAEAVQRLSPKDVDAASNAQRAAIDDSRSCTAPIAASDQRIAAAADALKAFRTAPTVAGARAALNHAQGLTAYDLGRDFSGKPVSPAAFDGLRTAVASFDETLQRVGAIAPLYRPGDPATIDTAGELAELGRKVASLPFPVPDPGLSATERDAVARASDATAALAEADRRIAVLNQALPRSQDDPVGLALALAALTPFDRARAKAAGSADIPAAEAAARAAVPVAVDRLAGTYRATPQRKDAEMLVSLTEMADRLGGTIEPQAAATVARAKTDIRGSEQRLAAVRDTAAAWTRLRASGARDPAVEGRVSAVLAAVVPAGTAQANGYDAPAMGKVDQRALGTLLGALVEIQGRLPAGAPRAVTVFAETGTIAHDATLRGLPAILAHKLEAAGFGSAGAPGEAALTLSLSDPAVRDMGTAAGGMQRRQVSVQGRLLWRYADRRVDLGTITGDGAARDPARALADAVDAAADNIVRTVLKRLESS